jgi:sugar transferase (PEP-CTERM system associated)
MFRKGIWLKTVLLLCGEAGIILSVVLLSLYARFAQQFDTILFQQRGLYKIAFTTIICQFIFYLFDLYDVASPRSKRELLTDLFKAGGVIVLVLGTVFFLRPTMLLGYLQEVEGRGLVRYGNGVPILATLLALSLMIFWRLGIHWLMRHPRLGERILIVGTDTLAKDVAREAMLRRDLGYKVVGFISEDPALVGQSILNPRVLGVTTELAELVNREKIDRVVVALPDRRGHMPVDQLLQLRLQGHAAIEEGTALFERLTGKISIEMLRPSWLIFSSNTKRGRFWQTVRRAFNITLALLGMVLSFPIAVLTVLAIKLDSRGPIFYTQERVGKNGVPFTIIKFRSMRTDAEKDGPQWSGAGDARITRVGKFIRATRIDELPQFINVLRGDLSFVGPRAERKFFVDQLSQKIPFYEQRHLVEPGLTGWAQVNYGYGSTVEDALQKFQYDLYYIKNASLLFDLWIMLKSIKIVLLGRGQ